MAARTMKQVSPDDVRQWAKETDWRDEYDREVADRGRLSTKLVTDYNNANRRHFREYVGGGGTPRPRVAERAESNGSAPAKKAQPAKATAAPAKRQARVEEPEPVRVESDRLPMSNDTMTGDATAMMVQDVINALSSAGNSRRPGQKGEPTLVTTTVSAHKLVYI